MGQGDNLVVGHATSFVELSVSHYSLIGDPSLTRRCKAPSRRVSPSAVSSSVPSHHAPATIAMIRRHSSSHIALWVLPISFSRDMASNYARTSGDEFGPPSPTSRPNAKGQRNRIALERARGARQTNNKQTTCSMSISQQEALARQAGTRSQCLKRDNQMV